MLWMSALLASTCVLRELAGRPAHLSVCSLLTLACKGVALRPLARQLAVWSPSGGGYGRQLLRWRRAECRGKWPFARSLALAFPLLLARGGRATADLCGGVLASALFLFLSLGPLTRSPRTISTCGRTRALRGGLVSCSHEPVQAGVAKRPRAAVCLRSLVRGHAPCRTHRFSSVRVDRARGCYHDNFQFKAARPSPTR